MISLSKYSQTYKHVLWGLSIDIMISMLYKLYILSTYPTPKHHSLSKKKLCLNKNELKSNPEMY